MSSTAEQPISSHQQQDRLIQLMTPWVEPLGYEIIYIEVVAHHQKTLRIFIDRLQDAEGNPIGIEDCVRVTRSLEDQLEQSTEIDDLFHGAYELEVSSPGINRPLRSARDFQRFTGQEARIHVYRPLSIEEIENEEYQKKNPKQKNFLGVLDGFTNDKVVLKLNQTEKGGLKKTSRKAKKALGLSEDQGPQGIRMTIPVKLISRANLEPKLAFEPNNERE